MSEIRWPKRIWLQDCTGERTWSTDSDCLNEFSCEDDPECRYKYVRIDTFNEVLEAKRSLGNSYGALTKRLSDELAIYRKHFAAQSGNAIDPGATAKLLLEQAKEIGTLRKRVAELEEESMTELGFIPSPGEEDG